MIFNINIAILPLSLLIACFVFALLAATVGLKYMRATAEKSKDKSAENKADTNNEKLPKLSVIVYVKNAESNITTFIDALIAQDYPDFEVIAVNDASIDNTAEMLDTLSERYPNLHLTFVPESARNVSRRKTAYTLGIKGANGEVVLLTNSRCSVPSAQWLRLMMKPFANPGIDIVLGTISVPESVNCTRGHLYRDFYNITSESNWVGAALCDHPYRGDSANLAFRKSTFFDNGGFTATNALKDGEDDIFINAVANSDNTAVVTDADATVCLVWPAEEYKHLWLQNLEARLFTAQHLNTSALSRQGFHSICLWAGLLCGVSAAILAWSNLLPAIIALVIQTSLWAYQTTTYKKAYSALIHKPCKQYISVPLLWLMRPLANIYYRIKFRADKDSHYVWAIPKLP